MLTFKRISPLLVLASLFVIACSNDECLENKNALPYAAFYTSQLEPASVALDSITVFGIGAPGDSILADTASNVSSIYLPFRIDSSQSSFVIRYEALKSALNADTITFTYNAHPFFVSAGCGVSYQYEIKDITTTHLMIDSVRCPVGVITNVAGTNINIYFK